MTPLAIFDLDNTLLGGDCEFLWTQFLASRSLVGSDYLEGIAAYFKQYDEGSMDYVAYEEFFLRPLTNLPFPDVLDLRDRYLETIWPRLRPWMLARVCQHQEQGHTVLVISASNHFLSRPIANMFGIDQVIGTEAIIENGRLTGKIGANPPFQAGKVRQLQRWLDERQMSLEDSWGYSDSHNDLPLMSCTAHPVAVTPDARLLEHALSRGWEILSGESVD